MIKVKVYVLPHQKEVTVTVSMLHTYIHCMLVIWEQCNHMQLSNYIMVTTDNLWQMQISVWLSSGSFSLFATLLYRVLFTVGWCHQSTMFHYFYIAWMSLYVGDVPKHKHWLSEFSAFSVIQSLININTYMYTPVMELHIMAKTSLMQKLVYKFQWTGGH